jgi:hypothetical protein
VINCWLVLRPPRHLHYGRWRPHIRRHIGHGHGHGFGGIAGAVGAASASLVCTEIGPRLWGSPPHLAHAYGGPGLGPPGLGPEEFSGAPVPFIGGPGFPVGTGSSELAAPSILSVGNGSGTSEISQKGNLGGLPGSIEINSTLAVAVVGEVPEPSSALLLIGAALAMALLRVRGSRRPLTRRRPAPISALGPGFRRDDE